jgi:hypothetical protein
MSTESNNPHDWLPFEIRILPDDPSVEMLPRSQDNFRPSFKSCGCWNNVNCRLQADTVAHTVWVVSRAVTLANKMVRIAFAILRGKTTYSPSPA